MHKLTKQLEDYKRRFYHSTFGEFDKIITDYLKGRAEWLLNQYNDHKEKDEIIREAFELPKEEKCEQNDRCDKCGCVINSKPIPSQPEKELPRKLNYIDKYPHPNHISLDVVCSQKIDEIIDYLQSLRKEK